jgi:hypothetical protein
MALSSNPGRKHHKKSPFCTRLLFLCIGYANI